LVFR